MVMAPPCLTGAWPRKHGEGRAASRAFLMGEGFTGEDLGGWPIIGIRDTWSELGHGNYHPREVREAVKRGGWQSCGLPLESRSSRSGRSSCRRPR